MGFSNWICSKSTKNMFVKIVHPGGHVELHDRPILAAEIIYRNPRCLVAHPHVFQQPWAIVAPETVLVPGHKFYVVPVSTIRKLQRHSNKYYPSPVRQTPTSQSQESEEQDSDSDNSSSCWFIMNRSKTPHSSINHNLDNEGKSANNTDSTAGKCVPRDIEKRRSSSNFISPDDQSRAPRNRTRGPKGSPKRHPAFDQWQPSLASVSETEE